MSRIPTIETCDQSNPEEALQWVFPAWPMLGDNGVTPSPELRGKGSRRLVELGLVHGPSLAKLADENGMIHVSQLPVQTLKLRGPHRGQQHWLNGAVEWVDVSEPDLEPVVVPDMEQYTVHEQAVAAEQMHHSGVLKREESRIVGARVIDADSFDPKQHPPNVVIGYLMAADDFERHRVLALEMQGKQRKSILNKPEWKGM